MTAVLRLAAGAPVLRAARVSRAADEPVLALVVVQACAVERGARAARVGARMGLQALAGATLLVGLAAFVAELAVERCGQRFKAQGE